MFKYFIFLFFATEWKSCLLVATIFLKQKHVNFYFPASSFGKSSPEDLKLCGTIS